MLLPATLSTPWRVLTGSSVTVTLLTQVSASAFPSSTSTTAIYSSLVQSLNSSIISGAFTTALQQASYALGVAETAVAMPLSLSVSAMTVQLPPTFSPTAQPTMQPTIDPTKHTSVSSSTTKILSTGAIIGIVIGGAVFIVTTAYLCYRYVVNRTSDGSTYAAVDKYLNMQDMYPRASNDVVPPQDANTGRSNVATSGDNVPTAPCESNI